MRHVLAFAATAGALVLLAAIAIALMISIAGERTSWVLVVVFAIDSTVLVLLAARATLRRGGDNTGRGGAVPR